MVSDVANAKGKNVASKNPIGRLADTAIKSLKDPVGTAGKVVGQAKGGAALGRSVVEHVGRSAFTKATETAGAVVNRATGHGSTTTMPEQDAGAPLRPVPDVNEPAHVSEPGTQRAGSAGATTKRAATSKTAKKAPAKKTAKSAASPADVAKTVEAAVAEDPSKTAATPAGAGAPGDKLPAKKAAGKKAAGKKTAGKKAPADKTAAEQSPANNATAKKAAKKTVAKKSATKKAAPKTAAQVAGVQGDDVMTPVGTPAADRASNPDTTDHDLNQPDTEGIVDSSTAKAVGSKAETLRKAAEKDPEG